MWCKPFENLGGDNRGDRNCPVIAISILYALRQQWDGGSFDENICSIRSIVVVRSEFVRLAGNFARGVLYL